MMPRVSIIMGIFNGEKRLDRAIESIQKQTYLDWELIICDDGSTDSSYKKLLEYSKQDSRIRIVQNKPNKGLAVALNKCLEVSKGEFIARMDDDDISHRDRIEKEVKFLDDNPQYDIVSSGRNMFDEKGIWGKDCDPGTRNEIDIFTGRFFAHPTVMVRKSLYELVEGYSTYPGIGREEDTDLWCKMYCAGGKGYVMEDILLDYSESRDSMSRRKFKYRVSECKIKLKYRKKLGVPFYYIPYAFKPILAGLLPNSIIKKIHEKRFG